MPAGGRACQPAPAPLPQHPQLPRWPGASLPSALGPAARRSPDPKRPCRFRTHYCHLTQWVKLWGPGDQDRTVGSGGTVWSGRPGRSQDGPTPPRALPRTGPVPPRSPAGQCPGQRPPSHRDVRSTTLPGNLRTAPALPPTSCRAPPTLSPSPAAAPPSRPLTQPTGVADTKPRERGQPYSTRRLVPRRCLPGVPGCGLLPPTAHPYQDAPRPIPVPGARHPISGPGFPPAARRGSARASRDRRARSGGLISVRCSRQSSVLVRVRCSRVTAAWCPRPPAPPAAEMMCGAPTPTQPATADTQAIADQVRAPGGGCGPGCPGSP